MENKNQRQDISILYAVVLFVYWKIMCFYFKWQIGTKIRCEYFGMCRTFQEIPLQNQQQLFARVFWWHIFPIPVAVSIFIFWLSLSKTYGGATHKSVIPSDIRKQNKSTKTKTCWFQKQPPCQNMSKSAWKIKTHQNWNLVTLVWWFP